MQRFERWLSIMPNSRYRPTDFIGEPVGDVNGNGIIDSRLDSEIAAFIALNQALVGQRFTNHVRVAVVSFGDTATNLDLNPIAPGM